MIHKRLLIALAFFSITIQTTIVQADVVVRDGETTLTAEELSYLLDNIPSKIVQEVQDDEAARYDYIAQVIQSKNIAKAAQQSPPESLEYFEAQYAVVAALKNLMQKRYITSLDVPNFTPLAKERYEASKEEIALVPEYREASHILLLCQPSCDVDEQRGQAEALRDRALDGEDFAALAEKFSDDKASARNGGRMSGAVAENARNVDSTFLNTLFDLESEGELSPVVRSQFGFHVIKLEKIYPENIRPFEELQKALEKEIGNEYIAAKTKEHFARYFPSEDLKIDGNALDQIIKSMK